MVTKYLLWWIKYFLSSRRNTETLWGRPLDAVPHEQLISKTEWFKPEFAKKDKTNRKQDRQTAAKWYHTLQIISHLSKKRLSQASLLVSTEYIQNRIIMFCLELWYQNETSFDPPLFSLDSTFKCTESVNVCRLEKLV